MSDRILTIPDGHRLVRVTLSDSSTGSIYWVDLITIPRENTEGLGLGARFDWVFYADGSRHSAHNRLSFEVIT